MLSRRDIEPMNQSPLAGKDGKGYVMSEVAIAAGEAWLVEQTRRERIREATKFVDSVFRLEGFESTEAIKAVDRAVLAGVGDWEEAVQEAIVYAKEHKSIDGFVYRKSRGL